MDTLPKKSEIYEEADASEYENIIEDCQRTEASALWETIICTCHKKIMPTVSRVRF